MLLNISVMIDWSITRLFQTYLLAKWKSYTPGFQQVKDHNSDASVKGYLSCTHMIIDDCMINILIT